MNEQRVRLWCKVVGRRVEVLLSAAGHREPPLAGVPEGWSLNECLEKDVDCFGKGCPFTMDGGEWPFGTAEEGPSEPRGFDGVEGERPPDR